MQYTRGEGGGGRKGALSLFMDGGQSDIFGLNSFGESDIPGSVKIFQIN